MDLVIILADNGYPPYTKDEVFKEILEQAENFKKHSIVIEEPIGIHMAAEPPIEYGK